jgi:hypothetical protein
MAASQSEFGELLAESESATRVRQCRQRLLQEGKRPTSSSFYVLYATLSRIAEAQSLEDAAVDIKEDCYCIFPAPPVFPATPPPELFPLRLVCRGPETAQFISFIAPSNEFMMDTTLSPELVSHLALPAISIEASPDGSSFRIKYLCRFLTPGPGPRVTYAEPVVLCSSYQPPTLGHRLLSRLSLHAPFLPVQGSLPVSAHRTVSPYVESPGRELALGYEMETLVFRKALILDSLPILDLHKPLVSPTLSSTSVLQKLLELKSGASATLKLLSTILRQQKTLTLKQLSTVSVVFQDDDDDEEELVRGSRIRVANRQHLEAVLTACFSLFSRVTYMQQSRYDAFKKTKALLQLLSDVKRLQPWILSPSYRLPQFNPPPLLLPQPHQLRPSSRMIDPRVPEPRSPSPMQLSTSADDAYSLAGASPS